MVGAGSIGARLGRRWRRGRVHLSLWILLAVLVTAVTFVGGLLAAPVDFTPPPAPRPALVVDRHGTLFAEIRSPEQREDVTTAQMAPVLRQAVVAAEDRRFYEHRGVDPTAIVRAAWADLTGGDTQGGSTITQQYVKKVFVGSQRTVLRKVREAALAIRLERKLSKDEILTRYLNIVPFGEGTYGVQAASKFYFGLPASALNLSQASMLAGIIPAPSRYNPVANMALARDRQKYVLNGMVESGDITSEQASDAYTNPPTIVAKSAAISIPALAPQYFAKVAQQVKARYADNQDTLYKGALQVQTSLDLTWQEALNKAVQDVLPKADDPEAAVIAIDYTTGDVLGLVDKVDADHAQFDPATLAVRTSGSTIKPFTLAAALEAGMTLDTTRHAPSSKTYSVAECGSPQYVIHNDEGGSGTYTLERALARSVNTVYGPLAVELGTTKVAALAEAAGLGNTEGKVNTNCAMGLGADITPLSEAVGYATLANGGVYNPPRFVTGIKAGVSTSGEGGSTIYTAPSRPKQVVPTSVANDVVRAMGDVVRYGTGTRAQQPGGLEVFGKTGTTDDNTDAWFTGCVPSYHVCVTTWMGYDSPRPMRNVEGFGEVQGGTLPAKIFAAAMDAYRSVAGGSAP
jgi:membrane peptidoglycan carboxypeptidase